MNDAAPVDTLTLEFHRDGPLWLVIAGPDIQTGSAGSGTTPLEALRDLCDKIARDEGVKTDNGKILLR